MRRVLDNRLATLEKRQSNAKPEQLEVVDLDETGKFVEVRWGDKPLARIAKEYWEML